MNDSTPQKQDEANSAASAWSTELGGSLPDLLEPPVLKMTVDEAIEFADQWSRGMTIHEGSQGWRVVCMLLADEVRKLRRSIHATSGREQGNHKKLHPWRRGYLERTDAKSDV